MRVGFHQFCPKSRDRYANLAAVSRALSELDLDLVVLPELCTTGYLFANRRELARFAEPVPNGDTCSSMSRLAGETGMTVVWGMAEKAGDRLYNSAVMATCDGSIYVYRKAHLFVDEKDIFDPGGTPFPVFNVAGVRLGMLVCFDHLFPEAARSLALAGAQVVCHPSNLVLDIALSTTLARSIENRVFWILANRTGIENLGDRSLKFTGLSRITAPDGAVLCQASPDSEETRFVDIDPGEALDKNVTSRNNVFTDRRTDLYRL